MVHPNPGSLAPKAKHVLSQLRFHPLTGLSARPTHLPPSASPNEQKSLLQRRYRRLSRTAGHQGPRLSGRMALLVARHQASVFHLRSALLCRPRKRPTWNSKNGFKNKGLNLEECFYHAISKLFWDHEQLQTVNMQRLGGHIWPKRPFGSISPRQTQKR